MCITSVQCNHFTRICLGSIGMVRVISALFFTKGQFYKGFNVFVKFYAFS